MQSLIESSANVLLTKEDYHMGDKDANKYFPSREELELRDAASDLSYEIYSDAIKYITRETKIVMDQNGDVAGLEKYIIPKFIKILGVAEAIQNEAYSTFDTLYKDQNLMTVLSPATKGLAKDFKTLLMTDFES